MIDRAVSSGASVEALEKLMVLQERWEANQGRKAFNQAIAAAKAEIPPIIKNKTVDYTSQKGRTHYLYEDLAEIAKTVDPIPRQTAVISLPHEAGWRKGHRDLHSVAS